MHRDAAYFLKRGLRRVSLALPVKLLVAFDLRVNTIPFRSRNSMIEEALQHFLDCPDADWAAGDQPSVAPSALEDRTR